MKIKEPGVKKFAESFSKSINKEFIPVIYVIATPFLAFMNGYGIRTFETNLDFYYILPVLFALYTSITEKQKMHQVPLFIILASVNVIMSLPMLHSVDFSRQYFQLLFFSYSLIILFFILLSASFFGNDPYFVTYYRTKNSSYKFIYILMGVFFAGVAVFHIVLFVKVVEILKLTAGH